MSVFVIKLLAMVSMIIDHVGHYLRPEIDGSLYTAMRSIGRFAFPVYCFLIVNGYRKTGHVGRYLTRLVAFAVISQLPFSLAQLDRMRPLNSALVVELGNRWFVCAIFILVAAVAWYTTVRADWSVLWPVLALTLSVLRVRYAGVPLLGAKMNVFYTLALGLSTIALLDGAIKPGRDVVKLLMQALGLFGAFCLIGDNADYGLLGVALIVGIWAAQGYAFSEAGVILLWCVMKFAYPELLLSRLLCSLLSLAPVFLYNGKLGRPMKLGFYAVYPLHLAVLGGLTLWQIFA